jgi:hypothetical protein
MSDFQRSIEDRLDVLSQTNSKFVSDNERLREINTSLQKKVKFLEDCYADSLTAIKEFVEDYEAEQNNKRSRTIGLLLESTLFKALLYAFVTGVSVLFIYYLTTDPASRFQGGIKSIFTSTNLPPAIFGALLTIGLNLVLNSIVANVQIRLGEKEKMNTLLLKQMCQDLIQTNREQIDTKREEFEKEQRAAQRKEREEREAFEKEQLLAQRKEREEREAFETKQFTLYNALIEKINTLKN